MDAPRRIYLTRRQALQALGVAVVAGAHGSLSSQAAAAATGAAGALSTASVGVHGELVASCFSTDWSTRIAVTFPAAVVITSSGTARSIPSFVEWDDRLFDVMPIVSVLWDGEYELVHARSARSGQMSFDLPGSAATVVFHPRIRKTYPAENIGEPKLTAMYFGTETALPVAAKKSSAEPWGVELRAEWGRSRGYRYPELVEVLSTGPRAVPAGAKLVARLNRAVPEPVLEWTGAGGPTRGLSSSVGHTVDRTFVFNEPISAGEVRRLSFVPALATSGGGRASLADVSQVFIDVPGDATANARDTRLYSIAAVTRSGTELSDDSARRKA